MQILVPKNTFLRVAHKFVPQFINHDKAVSTNATLLYKRLFEESADSGKCRLSQRCLAEECKFSVRALQNALRALATLGYIYVDHDSGGLSTYVLLYSEHVKSLLHRHGYDVLEDSSWYPRDAQPSTDRLPVANSLDALPPQDMRGGCAPGAYPSYNVYKKGKNNTPSAPPPSQPFGNDTPALTRGRGGFFAPTGKSDLLHLAFNRLWAVWPTKQARHDALRVFCALARAGHLPSLDALLETVEHLQAHDDRWQRGYAPNLVNWLRGERWADAPVTRSATGGGHENSPPMQASGQGSATPSAARMSSMQKSTPPLAPPLPELPPALDADVHTLCSLWPSASRSPVRAFFRALLAKGSEPDMGAVLGAARRHLAESLTPRPLFSWLREELRGYAA